MQALEDLGSSLLPLPSESLVQEWDEKVVVTAPGGQEFSVLYRDSAEVLFEMYQAAGQVCKTVVEY